jgi:hypothetical protein
MKPLILKRPHAYLIWKGRKKAIASDCPLTPDEKMIIVCDGEAFGEVVLKQPVTTKTAGFEMLQDEHCIKPEERRLWWPDKDIFYIYRFSELELYNQMLPVSIKGNDVTVKGVPKLDKKESVLIDKSSGLPSTILLTKGVVQLDTKQRAACDVCVPADVIKPLLKAVYETEFSVEKYKGNHLPVYDLCLVKSPRLMIQRKGKDDAPDYRESDDPVCANCIFNKNGFCELYNFEWDAGHICNDWESDKEAEEELSQRADESNNDIEVPEEAKMPYEIKVDEEKACVLKNEDTVIECYSFEEFGQEMAVDKADKLLTALQINVEAEEQVDEEKIKGLQLLLDEIRGQFNAHFYPPDSVGYGWVVDVSEDEKWLIADEDGTRYKVGFDKIEDGFSFSDRADWIKVETNYSEVGEVAPEEEIPESEEAKQFDDSDWDGAAANWDTAEAYCDDSLIDVNPSGEDKIKDLCKLPYRLPGKQQPNKNSLKTMPTGRGIIGVKKPDGVSQDVWDSKLKAAANKLIGWWPEAFDKPAPDSIYEIAGKEPPESKEEDKESEELIEEKAGRRLKRDWINRIKDVIPILKELLGWAEYEDQEKMLNKGFTIKQVDGKDWFFTWSSSGFRDRDNEIISTDALKTYVKEAETKDKGYFNIWHIHGTDFAEIKWQVVSGRVLMEAGPFLDNKIGKLAKEFFDKYQDSHPVLAPEGWGASIEFRYLPEEQDKGIYSWIWKTRTSVLAKSVSSNRVTRGEVMKLDELNSDQLQIGKELFGSENALQAALDEAEDTTKNREEEVGPENFKGNKSEPEPESKDELDETEPETKPEPVMEVLAETESYLLVEKLKTELEVINTLPGAIEELGQRVEALETKTKVDNVNKTRFSLFTKGLQEQQASESEETVVPEEDELAKAEPKQADSKKSGAGHFFGDK